MPHEQHLKKSNSKLAELLDLLAGPWKHAKNIESDSLAQRPALSNGNLITLLYTESWRNVRSQVLVPLLVTCVLRDEVEIFAADD